MKASALAMLVTSQGVAVDGVASKAEKFYQDAPIDTSRRALCFCPEFEPLLRQ